MSQIRLLESLGPSSPLGPPIAAIHNITAPDHHHRLAPLTEPSILQVPTFVLSMFYLLVTLAVIVQIVMHLYYKDRRLSFNFAFSLLCLIWGVLRTMVFMVLGFWLRQPYWIRYLLYWLPINLQFAIFSLLVLFYISVLYKTTWQSKIRLVSGIIYFVANIILLAGIGGCVAVGQSVDGNFADFLRSILTIVVFSILSVLLGLFGFKVYRYMLEMKTQPPQLHNITPRKVGLVTLISVFIFLSRCFYQAFTLILGVSFTFTNASWEKDAITAVCYFFWEVVTTTLIIVLFWRRGGSGGAPSDSLRTLPYLTTNASESDFAPGTLYSSPTALPRYNTLRAGERDSASLFPKSRGSPLLGSYYATSANSYSPM